MEMGSIHTPWLQSLIVITVAILITIIIDRIIKAIISMIASSKMMESHPWVEAFLQSRRLITIIGLAIYVTIGRSLLKYAFHMPEYLFEIIAKLTAVFTTIMVVMGISQVTKIINNIYNKQQVSRERPIKGYLQTIEILAYLLGTIFIVASLAEKSPLILLSGLGAATAILLLVFRDSILSLVAGMQLTMNGSIRVGDWIEMPQFNADGEVLEIALHNVKVQNWDKTITMIPAHKFLENSFKNWRGMQESGGRRIKRAIHLDLTSIRFLTEEDVQQFMKVTLLKDYLLQKQIEIADANAGVDGDLVGSGVNFRRLTNVGTFRAYVKEYLKRHPQINQNMTIMVRQMSPEAEGLPLEIYVFTNDTRWIVYEDIQADIFDHLLSALPEFGLRMYQHPAGSDVRSIRLLV